MPPNEVDREKNTHYVIHVRVEKVTVIPSTGVKQVAGNKNEREVEDVVSVVKKCDNLLFGVDFVKGVLELSIDRDQ
jgi:hypothetical protein